MEYLYGKNISEQIKIATKSRYAKHNLDKDCFLAILFFGENSSSKVYVKMKQKYWEDIGLNVKVFWQDPSQYYDDSEYATKYNNYDSADDILALIEELNHDEKCLWIIVQLPTPEWLTKGQIKILSKIHWKKDVDWLWGVVNWLSETWLIDFIPATPKAVLKLLEYYKLDDFRWKTISVIWQSNLVWKPLAIELMKKWATVLSFNADSNQDKMRLFCKNSDIIVSCTWAIHLINEEFINDSKNQILVDVWYWHKNGKAVWDVDFDAVKDKVWYIVPVPWWIWPLTVSCLFDNLFDLLEVTDSLKSIEK